MGRNKQESNGVDSRVRQASVNGKSEGLPETQTGVMVAPKPAEVMGLEMEVVPVVQQARDLVIRTNDDCVRADELRKAIKGLRGKLGEMLDAGIAAARTTLNTIKGQKDKFDDPLVEADNIVKDKVKAHVVRMQREKEIEDARLRREAEQKAYEAEQAKILERANALVEQGKSDLAAELLDEPVEIEPVKVDKTKRMVEVPKIDGRTIRDKWLGEVVNLKLLVEAIAKGSVPINAVQPNEKFLNAMAKQFKTTEGLNYPGVRVVVE